MYTQGHSYKSNMLVEFDIINKSFNYIYGKDTFKAQLDNRPIWQIFEQSETFKKETCDIFKGIFDDISSSESEIAYFTELYMKNALDEWKWFRVGFILAEPKKRMLITFSDINDNFTRKKYNAEYDPLTRLMNRLTFRKALVTFFDKAPIEKLVGKYAFIYFDIIKFKAINDLYGMTQGDRLLSYTARTLTTLCNHQGFCCRIGSDRFMAFLNIEKCPVDRFISCLSDAICNFEFEIMFNAGVYVLDDKAPNVDAMMDRAIIAQNSIKGSYTDKCAYFKEEMRKEMLSEQEIVGIMSLALADGDFVVYYQPQYNHSSGALIGAEALVRWNHHERGIIAPSVFVPIFEKNGFITKLDMYVFESVCKFIRSMLDEGLSVVPISTNFSRYDIYVEDFVEQLEKIRLKYDVPANLLKVELTESAVIGNIERATQVISQLHKCGYIIFMDDFGSGYSSLNVLKDIDLDVIKLDMKFLESDAENRKGGTIITAVVRMARWLNLPVIAEGVEFKEQADFLKSIGCDYVQGYLYSRPVTEEGYHDILKKSTCNRIDPNLELVNNADAIDFWNPKSQDTLVFNNYIGGAVIFDFDGSKAEILRANQKYLDESHVNIAEKDLLELDLLDFFDTTNKQLYLEALKNAIDSGKEQVVETWRHISTSCCDTESFCVRSTIKVIGKHGDHHLFYETFTNITESVKRINDILNTEKQFKMVADQVQVYFWEYNIQTKEMRPCFRCKRDLGLPSVILNYPDPVYESGLFPPETKEMYYDWMDRLAKGEKELEGIIPLTPDRIPFRVKYTTEFDKHGRPLKAYGSATLIVD